MSIEAQNSDISSEHLHLSATQQWQHRIEYWKFSVLARTLDEQPPNIVETSAMARHSVKTKLRLPCYMSTELVERTTDENWN